MKKSSRFAAAAVVALLLVAQAALAQTDPGTGSPDSWIGIMRNAACGLAVGLAGTVVYGIAASLACLLSVIDP